MLMNAFSLPLVAIVRENLSIMLDSCFARPHLQSLLDEEFVGEWKYLRSLALGHSEARANKVAVELALFLRLIDDREPGLEAVPPLGTLHLKNGETRVLGVRDVANKIIHASDLAWDLSQSKKPRLVCTSEDPERWERAEVEIVALAAFVGTMMA